uniref:Uncharacterized protein n=1 Tax=Lotharella oceanica TaxID=641309 RepID=A0A7S2TJS4_9EUKA|mmetsp:Transcript_15667/g.29737  ORF Transcript_15667/g.29737 Transcript_15667/m.29737 type:complete len:192 (+) Transcript_15667:92-667(+)
MFSLFSCGESRELVKRKENAKVVKRLSESEFMKDYQIAALFPENGAETLKTSLPKRGDFCGAIMDKVYFEHCLSQIRKPYTNPPHIAILLKQYDANYRARRILADKLLEQKAMPDEICRWTDDDKQRRYLPSSRNPKKKVSLCAQSPFSVHSRSMHRQPNGKRTCKSEWSSDVKIQRPRIANSVYKFTKTK